MIISQVKTCILYRLKHKLSKRTSIQNLNIYIKLKHLYKNKFLPILKLMNFVRIPGLSELFIYINDDNLFGEVNQIFLKR